MVFACITCRHYWSYNVIWCTGANRSRAGARCCCSSRLKGWSSRPSWPSATRRWGSGRRVYPSVRHQRCWAHKTANVPNYLPRSVQPKAKAAPQAIWMAETREQAEKACERFIATYGAKCTKATECLTKDRDALLVFYDFPAEHRVHLRTTNPTEPTFATIRHRSDRAKGCVSRDSMLAASSSSAWPPRNGGVGYAASRNWPRSSRVWNSLTGSRPIVQTGPPPDLASVHQT